MTRQKPCETCGMSFDRGNALSDKQWAARRYCSQTCTGKARAKRYAEQRPALRDKFMSLFSRTDGCWEWQGTIEGYGYGVVDHAGKRYRAHVLALAYDGRPVPKGMVACHTCDNPRCVRPDHLYVGTAWRNVQDAKERGRLAAGSRNHNAKLTERNVQIMRSLELPYTQIARMFGVSRPSATRAIKGTTWSHVK